MAEGFTVRVGSTGRYNLMGSEQSTPITITWRGESIKLYADADEHDAADLVETEWWEMAEFVTEKVGRYLYHGDAKLARDLAEAMALDAETDEMRVLVEEAEQEWRLPRAVAGIHAALRGLTSENQKRALEEVAK